MRVARSTVRGLVRVVLRAWSVSAWMDASVELRPLRCFVAVAEELRHDRQCRLRQTFFQPDGTRDRIRRRQSRAPQRRQGALARARHERDPHQQHPPGPVATDLWLGEHGAAATNGAATGVDAATVCEQAIVSMPTGRFTTPEEVGTLAALLTSPRTANVTGSNYVIDGGLRNTM
jgi:hypothetical protein